MHKILKAVLNATLYIILLVLIPNVSLLYLMGYFPYWIPEPIENIGSLQGFVMIITLLGLALTVLVIISTIMEDRSRMKLLFMIISASIWLSILLLVIGSSDLLQIDLIRFSMDTTIIILNYVFLLYTSLTIIGLSIGVSFVKSYFTGKESQAIPRISTGLNKLDDLLGGGIPESYSIVLLSPPLDERDLLIHRFIKSGSARRKAFIHISSTIKSDIIKKAKNNRNFYLVLCHSRANRLVKDSPNIIKIKGLDNLTAINVTIGTILKEVSDKGLHVESSLSEILSDIKLIHKLTTVRKWLRDVLSKFKAKNITTLWTFDSGMHSEKEKNTIINLFDGHLILEEKEIKKRSVKTLKIGRLYGVKYSDKELILKKDKLF